MDSATGSPSSATSGSRVVARGRQWSVAGISRSIDCAALRLREIGRDREQTLLTPFDRVRTVDGDRRPRVVRTRRWLHELDRALVRLHPFGSFRAAAQAPIRLLAYQLEPALAVLRHGAARLLIADGVGLGKTIQAGLLLLELAHRHESSRALVLAPAGLREQWLAELSVRFRLTPILADTAWLRATSAERPAHVNPWALPGIYIASHDLVKRPEVLRPLEDVTWDAIVIDEAHAATSGTDRRAAMHAIARRSRHVVLLTATPHGGQPAELKALCRIGGDDPIVLFQRTRADVGEGQPRKTVVLTVMPSEAERRMHDLLDRYSRRVWEEAGRRGDDRARLVSILLRKRALSSAGSLAASVERRMALLGDRCSDDPWQLGLPLTATKDEDPLEDDAPAAALSVPGLADPKRERRWLAAIAEAARTAARDERKIGYLLRLLSRMREPAIVFTEYRDTLARLEERIIAAGHPPAVLHGGLSPTDRSRVQQTFIERGGTLLATDAASEGLNLHHRCRVVIHYELPWSPARLEQRAGRVDRLGQTRRVHEVALVAAHTAERLVIAPLFARFAEMRRAPASREKTGTTPSRMLDALTESRVAAAVMTGTEPAGVDIAEVDAIPSCAVLAPTDLGAHAAREAARLEDHRVLAARSCRGHEPETAVRTVVSALEGPTRVPRGMFFVFALALVDGDGSHLHAEPCLVRVDLQPHVLKHLVGHRGRLRTRSVGEVVAAVTGPHDAILRSLLHPLMLDRLDGLATLEEHRREQQRRREKAIADAIAPGQLSAARLLVQAGLFDRRALRAAALQASSVSARQDAMHERAAGLADGSQPAGRLELIAALFVPAR
jgi:superfamily II DNA or RNA helicase